MSSKTFYGHGKLLLTGEYFVLDGSLALAVPTKQGQTLRVSSNAAGSSAFHWLSYTHTNEPWFSASFSKEDLSCLESTDKRVARRLTEVLQLVRKLSPDKNLFEQISQITTHLEFPRQWGLGSSSTLIYTLAKWAKIDAYVLLQATFGGSGYDLASADASGPLLYQIHSGKPGWVHFPYQPDYKDQLYFVYLNQKQNSREEIARYRKRNRPTAEDLTAMSDITRNWLQATSLEQLEDCIRQHEKLVSNHLGILPVKDRRFPDYWGAVKSLGAWGGDFVLVTSDRSEQITRQYFQKKDLDTFFRFSELVF